MKKKSSLSICLSLILLLLSEINAFAQGQFIYINIGAFQNNKVAGFSVAQNGTLTNLPNSPFFTGGTSTLTNYLGPSRLVVSPTANLLFVSNTGGNDVSSFTIDPMTGNLSLVPGSPFQTGGVGSLGISLAISPDGQFLFAANPGTHTITVFRVGADGALNPIPNSPFDIDGEAVNIIVSPNGKLLAASIVSFPNRLLLMNIASDGSLTAAPGSPLNLENRRPTVLEMNCESNLLFVLEGFLTPLWIDVFRVAADSSLTAVSGSPFSFPISDNYVMTLSNDERFLFVGGYGPEKITVINIAASGSLTLSQNQPLSLLNAPNGLTTNRSGTLLFTSMLNNVNVATVANDGSLTSIGNAAFEFGTVTSVAAYPPKTCAKPFDICLQDETEGKILKINSTTGDYQFTNCPGFTLTGTAELIKKGKLITLQHNTGDHRVFARLDRALNKANATIQIFSPAATFLITDKDTTNNSGACQ